LAGRMVRLAAATGIDEVLEELTSAAVDLTGATRASAWVADQAAGALVLRARAGRWIESAAGVVPLNDGAMGWVRAHRRVLHVPDILADARGQIPGWWPPYTLRGLLAFPLLDGEAVPVILYLTSEDPLQVDPDTRELMDALVGQSALAMRCARLMD